MTDEGEGTTDTQSRLMALCGGLQVVEWLAVDAQRALRFPALEADSVLLERLLKLQQVLARAQGVFLSHAFPEAKP